MVEHSRFFVSLPVADWLGRFCDMRYNSISAPRFVALSLAFLVSTGLTGCGASSDAPQGPQVTGDPVGAEGAHEHGVVRMGLTVEGEQLSMDLEIPGDALFGFERAPSTDDEWDTVEAALARLESGIGRAVQFSADVTCTVESFATVGAPSRGEGDDHDHDGDDHGHEEDGHDHDAHEEEGEAAHDEGDDHSHLEVEASASLGCSSALEGQSATLRVSEILSEVPLVDLTVLTAQGQAAARVAGDAEFSF